MLVMMFGYTHDMYFMARKTPSTDVMDDIDILHAKNCRTSSQRRGEGG
jgi:hypothetical protein